MHGRKLLSRPKSSRNEAVCLMKKKKKKCAGGGEMGHAK
jgi:hypothetical protein